MEQFFWLCFSVVEENSAALWKCSSFKTLSSCGWRWAGAACVCVHVPWTCPVLSAGRAPSALQRAHEETKQPSSRLLSQLHPPTRQLQEKPQNTGRATCAFQFKLCGSGICFYFLWAHVREQHLEARTWAAAKIKALIWHYMILSLTMRSLH